MGTGSRRVVQAAIEALQRGDHAAWIAQFSQAALGYEYFINIENINTDGIEITGPFHSDQWGDFRSYFRFFISAAGLIEQVG